MIAAVSRLFVFTKPGSKDYSRLLRTHTANKMRAAYPTAVLMSFPSQNAEENDGFQVGCHTAISLIKA